MTDARCEPPPELRGKDGWHWVQWTQTPGYEVECQQWFAEDGGFWGSDDIHMEGWRYLSPVLTPAEVAALRAERDAAWNEVEREREKYKDDMHAALVEVARWSQRSGLQDAELTTLRAEVERLRAALEAVCQGVETFHINPVGGENIVVDGGDRFAHERDVVGLLSAARAALEPQP